MNSSFKYTGLVPLTHLNTSMARRGTRFMRKLSCPFILNMSSYVRDLSRYTVARARSCNFSSLFILSLFIIKDSYTFMRHCSSKNLDIQLSAFIWQDAVWHILRMCSLDNKMLWSLSVFVVVCFLLNHSTALAESVSRCFWSSCTLSLALQRWLSSA